MGKIMPRLHQSKAFGSFSSLSVWVISKLCAPVLETNCQRSTDTEVRFLKKQYGSVYGDVKMTSCGDGRRSCLKQFKPVSFRQL